MMSELSFPLLIVLLYQSFTHCLWQFLWQHRDTLECTLTWEQETLEAHDYSRPHFSHLLKWGSQIGWLVISLLVLVIHDSGIVNYIHYKVFENKQWHPTPILLPGKSHGWRNLVGCNPWMGLQRVRHDWATWFKNNMYVLLCLWN